ncbi:helix-turn-helix domain-containing protein [Pseudomonas protegens]
MLADGRTANEVAELLGVHRATLYRALRGSKLEPPKLPSPQFLSSL